LFSRKKRLVIMATAVPVVLAAYGFGVEPARAGEGVSCGADSLLSTLRAHGIIFGLTYLGEVFHGFGLPGDDTPYRGMADLSISVGTSGTGLWPGGTVFLEVQNGHGGGLGVMPGGVDITVSAIDASNYTQVYQYGISQKFLHGSVKVMVGKQDANYMFDVNETGGDFIFPSVTLIPTVPMPAFPAPALGAEVFVEPSAALRVGLAAFDGGPKIGGLGFDTAFDGKGGYFSVLEPVVTLGPGTGTRRRVICRPGAWYHSGPIEATGKGGGVHSGNHGYYLVLESPVPEGDHEERKGLGVFALGGWAPRARNPIHGYVAGGLTYVGLLHRREDDEIGLEVGRTGIAGEDPPGCSVIMTHVEAFYLASVASWLGIWHDVQYFDNPGGGEKNGWAVGLRFAAAF
jgi:carbohydrate-selective porin OprB